MAEHTRNSTEVQMGGQTDEKKDEQTDSPYPSHVMQFYRSYPDYGGTPGKSGETFPKKSGKATSKRRLSFGDMYYQNGKANGQPWEVTSVPVWTVRNVDRQNISSSSCSEEVVITGERRSPWRTPLDNFISNKQDLEDKSKRVRSFYLAQNELISAYEDIDKPSDTGAQEASDLNSEKQDKAVFFSKITLLINVLLLVAKTVSSILSGSISIISSLVDTCLDLFSGVIMWWATRSVKKRDPYTYPQGRTKLEPVAIIILAVVMAFCSLMIIRESIETMVSLIGDSGSMPTVDAITFAISGSVVVIKCIMWLVYRRVTSSSIVQALAQDSRNDVLSNSVAILCGYLGSKNFKEVTNMTEFCYIDPIGAMLISFYIIFNWWQTGREQIKLLTGHTAGPEVISKLTWICINHHPEILYVDTLRAFYFGCNFLVEADIVLPADMPVQKAHNIGESLQQRLEALSEVERAFVHIDYEYSHKPSVEHKVV